MTVHHTTEFEYGVHIVYLNKEDEVIVLGDVLEARHVQERIVKGEEEGISPSEVEKTSLVRRTAGPWMEVPDDDRLAGRSEVLGRILPRHPGDIPHENKTHRPHTQ